LGISGVGYIRGIWTGQLLYWIAITQITNDGSSLNIVIQEAASEAVSEEFGRNSALNPSSL
jgi:hypothetical protein